VKIRGAERFIHNLERFKMVQVNMEGWIFRVGSNNDAQLNSLLVAVDSSF